jgi:hypothetical protein
MKRELNSHVMANLNSRGYTNPYCYVKYMGSITETTLGLNVKVAMTETNFATCTSTITSYYNCKPQDLATLNHPCQFVFSSLPLRN